MSFGVGLGDCLLVIQLAKTLRQGFIESPRQFQVLSVEIGNLERILQHLQDDILVDNNLTLQQKHDLEDQKRSCDGVLDDLHEFVLKNSELRPGCKNKARRTWQQLTFDSKAVDLLRARLTSSVTSLNLFYSLLISQAVQDTSERTEKIDVGVHRLSESRDHDDRQKILMWLSSANYELVMENIIRDRVQDTGNWLLKSGTFEDWVDGAVKTLYCPGMPGAGKTMMSAIVITELQARFRNNADVGMGYVFCNYRRQDEQSIDRLLASLLTQLLRGLDVWDDEMKKSYEQHMRKNTRPLTDELRKDLRQVSHRYTKVFCVVDALDECTDDDRTRRQLLAEISTLQAQTGVKFFTTSRFVGECIERMLKDYRIVEIRACPGDVRKFVDSQADRLSSCVKRKPDLKEEIKNKIVDTVDGMFLLARLHVDSLIDKTTPRALRIALDSLATTTGSEALDAAFDDVLNRINNQAQGFRDLARRVLYWLTYARRELTIAELQCALAIGIDEYSLDEDNITEIDEIVSSCAGLVTVDSDSVVRLVHYTAQEYLSQVCEIWTPLPQLEIAKACMTYLSFDKFTGRVSGMEEYNKRSEGSIFLEYAAKYWGSHACTLPVAALNELPWMFMEDNAKLSCISQVMCTAHVHGSSNPKYVVDNVNPLHIAAHFGAPNLLLYFLDTLKIPPVRDSHGQGPLSWACRYGHKEIVKILLARGSGGHYNINEVDEDSISPLILATNAGHLEICNVLLAKPDLLVNEKDCYGYTALHHAAGSGYEEIARALLRRSDVAAGAENKYKRTPLDIAVQMGRLGIVELLLARDDVEPIPKMIVGRR